MMSKIISKIDHWLYFRYWDIVMWKIKHTKNIKIFLRLVNSKSMKKSMDVLFKRSEVFGGDFRKKSTQLSKTIFEKGFELIEPIMDQYRD